MQNIQNIIAAIHAAGGRALLVGGAVRDELLGATPQDRDIEVYGLDADALQQVLASFGTVNVVGRSFGIIKLRTPDGDDLDFSLPRRDSKVGDGHRGFVVSPDPDMSPQQAAARRDFTVNAMARDLVTGELLDFFGGQADLAAGCLRHTSEAFAEDPLRVFRGMQFAARFDLHMPSETAALCRSLLPEAHTLAPERVWGEWEKLLLKGTRPSAGLQVLSATGWLALYPELVALIGCEQDQQHHPEGDVWQHTLHVMDAAAEIAERDNLVGDDRLVVLLAALCHDLGKPSTTVVQDGRIRSPGHAEAGEAPTRALLQRIGAPARLTARVVVLVRQHMAHVGSAPTPRTVRRLAVRLAPATIREWARVVEADHSGRPPLPAGSPAHRFVELAEAEGATQAGGPAPILLGRHLIALGVAPGPQMGQVLKAAFAAQVEGAFDSLEGAIAWVQR